MFEIRTNQEIGSYLKKKILSVYPSCRQFCIAYVDLRYNIYENDYDVNFIDNEIRRLTNRLSQMLKGVKAVQTYDLPIFTELLGVSCEEILTAGKVCKPINNRKTNYNIAFSQNESDWIDYLNREDCIAAYADEFGKTVVDYALEFKNYEFVRFLMNKGYIKFISDQTGMYEYNFGALSTIKERPYSHPTLEEELLEKMTLRTQLIALALENNDYSVLDELKAREYPVQYGFYYHELNMLQFDKYYDENYIQSIVEANNDVINYFSQEYYTISNRGDGRKYEWIFPFFGQMIEKALNNNKRADKLLDIAIEHNKSLFVKLKKEILHTAREQKNYYPSESFTEILRNVLRDFHINTEKNCVLFYAYWCKSELIMGIAISVNAKTSNSVLQDKIDLLNEYYDKIINIENYLIKN